MNSIKALKQFLVAIIILSAVTAIADTNKLTEDQLTVLIDNTVLPIVKSYCDSSKKGDPHDVIIEEVAATRKRLSAKYQDQDKCLKFELSSSILYTNGSRFLQPSNTEVYVNKFHLIQNIKDECIVEWDRSYSSLSATTKRIVLKRSKGKWIVSEIKLISVS